MLLEPDAIPLAQRRALARLDDSKRCTSLARDVLLPAVLRSAIRVSLVVMSVPEVDSRNIHRANLYALARALEQLDAPDDTSLIADGFSCRWRARTATSSTATRSRRPSRPHPSSRR